METVDTDTTGRSPATAGRWVASMTAALLSAAGCDEPAKAPIWHADPCDSATEFEKCTADAPTQRWRCDPVSARWLTLAFCPIGSTCAAADLPAEATGGIGTTCVAHAPDGSSAGDGAIADAALSGDTGPTADSASPKDAGKDTDAGQGGDAGKDGGKDGADTGGGLCGNGVCDKEESGTACPKDCGTPVCGDSHCQIAEATSCPYDCTAGAAAGAACMMAKCPGEAQPCKASSSCPVALAAVWSCAQDCSGCLPQCLTTLAKDPKVFAVASCSAALCL